MWQTRHWERILCLGRCQTEERTQSAGVVGIEVEVLPVTGSRRGTGQRGGSHSAGAVRQGLPGHVAGLLLPGDMRRGKDRFAWLGIGRRRHCCARGRSRLATGLAAAAKESRGAGFSREECGDGRESWSERGGVRVPGRAERSDVMEGRDDVTEVGVGRDGAAAEGSGEAKSLTAGSGEAEQSASAARRVG